jgi:hypothetical protein
MKFFQPLLCLLSFVGLALGSAPSNNYYQTHLTFGAPMTTRLPYRFHHITPEPYNYTQVEGKIDLNQIVNIAENTWNFIEANKPTVDINTNFANAVPLGVTNWTQLENWQEPMSQCFQVEYTNGFGMNVVGFTYCVVYTPGGDYNGKGLYLNHVQIIPSDIQVSWGYKLDAVTTVPSISNSGSTDNPVASAEVHMKFSVTTAIKKDSQEHAYYVKGDGSFMSLN